MVQNVQAPHRTVDVAPGTVTPPVSVPVSAATVAIAITLAVAVRAAVAPIATTRIVPVPLAVAVLPTVPAALVATSRVATVVVAQLTLALRGPAAVIVRGAVAARCAALVLGLQLLELCSNSSPARVLLAPQVFLHDMTRW